MGEVSILDAAGQPVAAGEIERIRMQASQVDANPYFGPRSPYRAGAFDGADTASWWPENLSADRAILENKDMSVARVRDAVRNNPTARAAVDRLVDMIVGAGLNVSARPDAAAIGIDPDQAHDLGRAMETEWRLFGHDPRRTNDAQRKLSINGQFRLAARTQIIAGEATAVLTWRAGKNQRYSTCVQAISPDRLSNPHMMMNTKTLRGGVEMDRFGAPIAYHVRNAHESDYWALADSWSWTRVPRTTSWGRPVFIHAFEPEGEDQTRAMTPFASLVTRLRMVGKFADLELEAATANALIAAFVETPLPPAQVATMMSPGHQHITSSPVDINARVVDHFTRFPAKINGARIPVFPMGTKLTMNNTPRQTTAFPAFQRAFLQSIASSLGLSYEQLTMDWTSTNYSSARAALNEVWRAIRRMSAVFVEQFVTPIYHAVMEEAFDKGYLMIPVRSGAVGIGHNAGPAPAFDEMPGAYLRARWIGPGRGYIDPVKEAEGAALRMENMTSTLERENAEQGESYEETLDQIQREEKELALRGLTRLSLVAAVQSTKGPKPDSEDATGPAGPHDDVTGREASQ